MPVALVRSTAANAQMIVGLNGGPCEPCLSAGHHPRLDRRFLDLKGDTDKTWRRRAALAVWSRTKGGGAFFKWIGLETANIWPDSARPRFKGTDSK